MNQTEVGDYHHPTLGAGEGMRQLHGADIAPADSGAVLNSEVSDES